MFLQIYKILSNFDSNLLVCDPTLFPSKNSPNIAKNNRVFPGKGKKEIALILTYLDSRMAEVFPHSSLSFSISVIFRGKRVVKVGPKMQTLGSFLFHQNSNTLNFFETMLLFARVLPLVRIPATLHYVWGSKGQKTSQKESWYAKL